ncbi:MAG: hypothetical protein NT000_11465 [Proteobacteria bacterium]|nr:hypothetical protein [Pseudomonadota bacterium]
MAMDPSEKDRLLRKMATQMSIFLGGAQTVTCVSSHYYEKEQGCELCLRTHTLDLFVIKNRAGKKMSLASSCLREMVRFQVTDVEDFPKWLAKISDLKNDVDRRKAAAEVERQEERQRLGKKVIVRKRSS